MIAVAGLLSVCAGAAARLRTTCRELDPRSLGWVSSAGEPLADRLELERSVIRRAADDLDDVAQFLRRAGVAR